MCKQAQRALCYALGGDCRDPLLQDLEVISVDPAPNAFHLIVTVMPGVMHEKVTTQEVLIRLGRVAGFLRSEVAAAIRRRRAPELSFRVLKRSTGKTEEG